MCHCVSCCNYYESVQLYVFPCCLSWLNICSKYEVRVFSSGFMIHILFFLSNCDLSCRNRFLSVLGDLFADDEFYLTAITLSECESYFKPISEWYLFSCWLNNGLINQIKDRQDKIDIKRPVKLSNLWFGLYILRWISFSSII